MIRKKAIMDLKERVEEVGVALERFGRTPIESRVFAYLLVSDPPYKSFDDIVEFIGASKSSVSNAINMYQKEGTITYKTFSGDRKRYFMIDADGWRNSFINSAKSLTSLNIILEEVIKDRKGTSDKKFNQELRDLLDFQTYFTEKMIKILESWKKT